MSRPRILIVSDSAHVDTGFGRVAREVGTRLVLSGKYEIVQFGWFHRPSDRLVPFRVIETKLHERDDAYGAITFPKVVAQVKPDLILAIGDEWMIRHIAHKPRNYIAAAYIPIDGDPINPEWIDTMRMFDHVVAYGQFGAKAISVQDKELKVDIIGHGVDTDVFYPMPENHRQQIRQGMWGCSEKDAAQLFVVGCVARNNPRKMIPRLLKAFHYFVKECTVCNDCGHIEYAYRNTCYGCGGKNLLTIHDDEKKNCRLYLHTVPSDPAGHKLLPLLSRYGIIKRTGIPVGMMPGAGVADIKLNEIYNSFHAHMLLTGGEGWGLPLLESMSAGIPTIATGYSGHVDFMEGAGVLVAVADTVTARTHNGEQALADIDDAVMQLDRMFYDRDAFLRKWQKMLISTGHDPASFAALPCGVEYRNDIASKCRERALIFNWDVIVKAWITAIDAWLPPQRQDNDRPTINVEVFC